MNSASQPAGISSAGSPGAALTQTAGTRLASAKHQSSGGSDRPARNRRGAPESVAVLAGRAPAVGGAVPGPERRAGSMNTASKPSSRMSRTSATTARTFAASP